MSDLFNKIKYLCSYSNINISQLEKKLGFGRGTIFKWKNSFPTCDKIKLVAQEFSVSTDFLLGADATVDTDVETSYYLIKNKTKIDKNDSIV